MLFPAWKLLPSGWTWAGTAGPLDSQKSTNLTDRLDAVESTSWNGVGLLYSDILKIRKGCGYEMFANMCRSKKLVHIEIELLTEWWKTDSDTSIQESIMLDAAKKLGAAHIKVSPKISETRTTERPDRSFINALERITHLAEDASVKLALEPMAMSNVPDLESARQILDRISSPSLGLLLDTWHLGISGVSSNEIRRFIDISEIFAVELSGIARTPNVSLRKASASFRALPDRSDIQIEQFVSTLNQIGWTGPWAVEVMSPQSANEPLEDFLRECRSAAIRLLEFALDPYRMKN